MNKIIALMAIALLVLALPAMAFAAEDNLEEIPVMPDSPFYGMSKFMERVQYTFTFQNEKKAMLELKFAERRLVESEAMMNKGDNATATKLMTEYAKGVNNTYTLMNKSMSMGRETGDLEIHIMQRISLHTKVLERVMANAPSQAQSGLRTALQNAQQNIDGIEERIQERVQERIYEGENSKVPTPQGQGNGI